MNEPAPDVIVTFPRPRPCVTDRPGEAYRACCIAFLYACFNNLPGAEIARRAEALRHARAAAGGQLP